MKIENYIFQKEIQENKEFVEGIIYENIDLMDENMRLALENTRLRNRLEELNRLYYRLFCSSLFEEGEINTLNFRSKDRVRYTNRNPVQTNKLIR